MATMLAMADWPMTAALLALALAALLAPPLARRWDQRAGVLLALAPFAAFVWFATQIPQVAAGQFPGERLAWVPALDIALSLRLDGLSLLFALLITGIGSLIVLYAGAYLSVHRHLGRFYSYLLLFMLAMLGLVLADDLIALFVFWELTSVASYLLISFQHTQPKSRRAALQALLITGGGGLALLAGLLLLGSVGGAWRFSELDAALIEGHALYPAILVLLLLGCFTKSAQIPFHLWLPNAMAAPTPVSAYLHSATMVKAGVYLLARLNPTLGGEPGWGPILVAFGAATAILGALLAIRQTDLKRLLAYTTVAVLGQLTMLVGTNTGYGLQAFVLVLLAHSLYKGALFMAVGAIDHSTGTRELARLGGLIRHMPLTGAAVGLAAFSNAGLPPFFGFIAKEFKYSGLVELGPIGWGVTGAMILTNALLLAAAGLVFIRTFLGPRGDYPRQPHEVSLPMWLGPMLLALGGLVLGAWNEWPELWLVDPAVQAMARGEVTVGLYLWGGLTPALLASFLTVSLGVLCYWQRRHLRLQLGRWRQRFGVDGDALWDRGLQRVFALAGWAAAGFRHASLQANTALLAVIASLGLLIAVWLGGGPAWPQAAAPASSIGIAGALLAVLGAAAVTRLRSHLGLLAAMGASGLGLSLLFVAAHAPDVAATQLMVEALTVVLLALALRRLPALRAEPAQPAWLRQGRLWLALAFGASVSLALALTLSQALPGDIASWYLQRSLPDGHGGNVVNVILVDFRAFDTLGEIVVVALAGLAAAALLGRSTPEMHSTGEPAFASVLLQQSLRPLAAVLLAASLWLLWRGHNLPGGGFIGGLMAASGCVLLLLAHGHAELTRRLRLAAPLLVVLGLACALGAGVLALLAGQPFLTALWRFPGDVPIGTPLLFDLGVFLTVLGALLQVARRLALRQVPA